MNNNLCRHCADRSNCPLMKLSYDQRLIACYKLWVPERYFNVFDLVKDFYIEKMKEMRKANEVKLPYVASDLLLITQSQLN